jgi:hypothetical protein
MSHNLGAVTIFRFLELALGLGLGLGLRLRLGLELGSELGLRFRGLVRIINQKV